MDEDRNVVAPVLVGFAVGAAMAYLPVAVGNAGNFAPVHVTVAITLLVACFITPAVAGYFIGRSHAEARQLALLVLVVGLPAVVMFSLLASGVQVRSLLPVLIVIFLIMFAALLGYLRGREGPVR